MSEPSAKQQLDISLATIIRVIAVIAVIAFLFLIRDILAILFFSILLILLLQPAVTWFNRYHIPRALGVLIIYSLLGGLLALVFVLIIPPITQQLSAIISQIGEYSQVVARYFGVSVIDNDLSDFKNILVSLQNYLPSATQDIFARLSGLLSAIITLVVVFVITFYSLVEESAFKRIVRGIIPSSYQPYLYQVASRIQRKLGLWLRGQILLGLVIFVFIYLGLTILGVDYALTIALVAGILEFIPYVGPLISGSLAVLLTLAVSPIKAMLVGILFIVVQQLENHLLVPKVMQKFTGINPVVSVVSLLIGARLGGFVGLLLAIPVATAISVFVQDIFEQRSGQQFNVEE